MDHHCRKWPKGQKQKTISALNAQFKDYFFTVAWLNNCVGFANHRYFFMYMLYTVIGSLFLIVFGIGIAYNVLWLNNDEEWTETEPLEGHPITYNKTGHIVPIVS